MAQHQLQNPEDLFHYQLRSALTMEQNSLEALQELEKAARDAKVKKLFSHHADETKEQIENLGEVFELVELKESTAPSPASTGIKNQAASLLEKADESLHDQVALASALGNEHFEMAVYDALILQANALGAGDAAKLLTANMDQEVHTSEELHSALKEILS